MCIIILLQNFSFYRSELCLLHESGRPIYVPLCVSKNANGHCLGLLPLHETCGMTTMKT